MIFGLKLWELITFDTTALVWGILATIPLLLVFGVCKVLPFENFRAVDRIVRQLFESSLRPLSVWKLAMIALLAGLGEELLFRGLCQTGLLKLLEHYVSDFPETERNATVLLAVSVPFGLGHFASPTYFALAFLISIYLGVLLIWTDNLLVPIAVHSLYDFLVFLWYAHAKPVAQSL